jgi:hypothetical protein
VRVGALYLLAKGHKSDKVRATGRDIRNASPTSEIAGTILRSSCSDGLFYILTRRATKDVSHVERRR